MPQRVRITDVSPRDGLQNEPGIIPTTDKIRLVQLLAKTGVDEIEVTSFVSPKWVPQLGDGAELFKALLHPLPEGGGGGWVSPMSRPPDRWRPPARQTTTTERAQALRHAMTGPELALWDLIRDKRMMGAKFRRQHPFGPFILDFFCQEKLLALELDGITHRGDEARQYDAERDAWIARHGVHTVRIANDAVLSNPTGVAEHIRRVLESRPAAGALKPTPLPPPSGRGGATVLFSALVPNAQGMQGVLDVNRAALRRVIEKVSVFTAASETFSRRNTNASIAETIERFRPVILTAHAEGLAVRGYVSCAIACPFEGPIAPDKVARVCDQLRELGVDELDIGDTIGAGTPETVGALLKKLRAVWPMFDGATPGATDQSPTHPLPRPSGDGLLTLHLHDTFGRAAACVRAALDMGVRSFDGSVAGLGGCPYASTTLPDGTIRRAPGNISTELLVTTIHDAGYETGVDLAALAEAATFARAIVAKSRTGAGA